MSWRDYLASCKCEWTNSSCHFCYNKLDPKRKVSLFMSQLCDSFLIHHGIFGVSSVNYFIVDVVSVVFLLRFLYWKLMSLNDSNASVKIRLDVSVIGHSKFLMLDVVFKRLVSKRNILFCYKCFLTLFLSFLFLLLSIAWCFKRSNLSSHLNKY